MQNSYFCFEMKLEYKTLAKYIEDFSQKTVLVIGDVMLDSYKIGNTSRLSPEAPVPLISVEKNDNKLGGAANVALNIKSMGANPILCSVIGNDNYGKIFKSLLRKNKISSEYLIIDNSRPTTLKTRIMARGQQLLRIDEESDVQICEDIEYQLFQKINEIINTHKVDVIIFEDYDKGVISKKLISLVVELSKQYNIKTAVDPKKRNFNFYCKVDLFKPNFQEFSNGLSDLDYHVKYNNLEESAKDYLTKQEIKNILITLSEKGIFITDKNNSYNFPAMLRNIADVSGAGDSVISIAALLLSINVNIEEIAYISNIVGGLACEKIGVESISKKEILKTFDKN